MVDQQELLAYLETDVDLNVAFYEKFFAHQTKQTRGNDKTRNSKLPQCRQFEDLSLASAWLASWTAAESSLLAAGPDFEAAAS